MAAARCREGDWSALAPSRAILPYFFFTSTDLAVIVYSMVTLEPTFRSPLTLVSGVRAISHFSLPFWTTILLSVSSSTGPVTW